MMVDPRQSRLVSLWVRLAIIAVPGTTVLALSAEGSPPQSSRPVEVQALLSGNRGRQLSAIRSLLRHGREKHRLRVIQILSRIPHRDVKWILLEFLKKDLFPTVRRVTVKALRAHWSPGDLPQLTALLLREKDPVVRRELQQQRKRLAPTGAVAPPQQSGARNVRAGAEAGSTQKKASRGSKPRRGTGRKWRLRFGAHFTMLYGVALWGGGKALAGEAVVQVELFNHYVIQVVGAIGRGEGQFYYGAGAGLAYEFEWVRDILRFELGGVVGFFNRARSHGFTSFGVFRPTLHVGYKNFFFSVGPRLAIGMSLQLGFVAGLTLRV